MRVDFYLLSKDTVEAALPRIAKSVKGAGERLLVVSEDAGQLAALDKALWEQAFGFERAFLFVDSRTIDAARGTWRMLGERDDVERHFWKQEGGRWVEGP